MDPDTLYHYRHAALYAAQGPLAVGMPWFTGQTELRTDIWWGFHLLLAPLAGILPYSVFGPALVEALVAILLVLSFRTALRRLHLCLPDLWSFLLLFAAPGQLSRWLSGRPQVLTCGLLALLLALLLSPNATTSVRQIRMRLVAAGTLGYLIPLCHLTLAGMVPLIVSVVLGGYWIAGVRVTREHLGAGAAAILGTLGAFFLRPDPVGAARTLYVQTVVLAQTRHAGLPLLWGDELFPPRPLDFLVAWGPFLLLIIICATTLFLRRRRRTGNALSHHLRAVLIVSGFLSVVTFAGTAIGASRASDLAALVGVLLLAALTTALQSDTAEEEKKTVGATQRRFALPASLLFLVLFVGRAVAAHFLLLLEIGTDLRRLQPAGQWLARNTPPDSLVFYSHWEAFPELFFWNSGHNRYVSGMDPIFLYARNPGLYWATHRLALGGGPAAVSRTPPGTPDRLEATYDLLTHGFGASYLFVDRRLSPGLFRYAAQDRHFRAVYQDAATGVFAIVSPVYVAPKEKSR